ncbi:hypothetical protein LPJ57_005020, partial [Coemansia sp. RSA 486]
MESMFLSDANEEISRQRESRAPIRQQVADTLSYATVGSLTIVENGQSSVFGNPSDGGPHVVLTVLSEQFWVRLMLVQDLGFAEA